MLVRVCGEGEVEIFAPNPLSLYRLLSAERFIHT